jgi:hypothetical protein
MWYYWWHSELPVREATIKPYLYLGNKVAQWRNSCLFHFPLYGFNFLPLTVNSLLCSMVNSNINPLNAKLNPICHLLVLLGDLTFMVPCIVSIFQYTCISNKMQRYSVRHPQHTQTGSNSSTIAADSSNGVTNTRCCRYSCMRSWW